MTAVAILLMPTLALLLYAMDRLEERMRDGEPVETPAKQARYARPRHLRLVLDPSPAAEVPEHGERPDTPADAA
ncbi:hypothetical protein [Streptomyces sp. NPDC058718]|uniref:hypothetical protein n=1 Tax=Streptomyces sp. NPDC058718 TaxID=3346610 RepID=UPI003691338B